MMSKYNAQKSVIDNIRFDSRVEGLYYIYLKEQGIKHELQPKYILQEKFKNNKGENIRAINYIADFSYGDIVVDVKGMPTSDAKLKRKMFMKKYPELELQWIVRFKGERVDYFANEKRKRDNKKLKLLNSK